uniref:Phosphatidylinositol 3,4,5-trisphosphate 3-phosphatase and dual-specificity protein phosphatase PTEN n=1 Tax=Trichogramma kaykai TaxID=54128 RepID=A0ABD2XEJ6_9HYME
MGAFHSIIDRNVRKPTGTNRLNCKIAERASTSLQNIDVGSDESKTQDSSLCVPTTHKRGRRSSKNIKEEESGNELLVSENSEQKQNQPAMSNTISNMKMTNPIKGLVSKQRKRFTADGFDLDLTYIKNNLIAMGYPAEKLEGVYRNHIDDVVKFLEAKHPDHYKIYNLCSERSYDVRKFKQRVATYAFDDHNPPALDLIQPFCEDVHSWLTEHENNVAAVHCKAGKGRTGVMISCYLLYSKQCLTATDALSYYGTERTHDKKGVTIPSQRRYVNYFSSLVKDNFPYKPVPLLFRKVILTSAPAFNGGQGYKFVITENKRKIYHSPLYDAPKNSDTLCFTLPSSVSVKGDLKVDMYYVPKMKRKEKIFHFWFNTFFVTEEYKAENGSECDSFEPTERTTRAQSCDASSMSMVHPRPRTGSLASLGSNPHSLVLAIDKWNLDKAHKDKTNKIFPHNFQVKVVLDRVVVRNGTTNMTETDLGQNVGENQDSESSEADSSECETTGDEDGWESGKLTQEPSTSVGHKHKNITQHRHSKRTKSSQQPKPKLLEMKSQACQTDITLLIDLPSYRFNTKKKTPKCL